jgi:hypothetical protein
LDDVAGSTCQALDSGVAADLVTVVMQVTSAFGGNPVVSPFELMIQARGGMENTHSTAFESMSQVRASA